MPGLDLVAATACPSSFGAADFAAFARLLDADERARARRFVFEGDRRAYVLAHALRRSLLAPHAGVAPAELRFETDAQGQPRLASDPQLHFSLSRTPHIVACAVTRAGPVGIDVEPQENAMHDLTLLQPFVRSHGGDFLAAWTALEAFWKAMGTGLDERNPRIWLRAKRGGWSAVLEEGREDEPAAGHVLIQDARGGACLSVALRAPVDELPQVHLVHVPGAKAMALLSHVAQPPRNSTRPNMAA